MRGAVCHPWPRALYGAHVKTREPYTQDCGTFERNHNKPPKNEESNPLDASRVLLRLVYLVETMRGILIKSKSSSILLLVSGLCKPILILRSNRVFCYSATVNRGTLLHPVRAVGRICGLHDTKLRSNEMKVPAAYRAGHRLDSTYITYGPVTITSYSGSIRMFAERPPGRAPVACPPHPCAIGAGDRG